MNKLISIIGESVVISIFVFSMMLILDYLNVLTKNKFKISMEKSKIEQYILSSFLGATPGCLGAFTNVTMYIHGLISFGALVGGMIATSGDEAFVMLTLFPKKAIELTIMLFFMGIFVSWLTDKLIKKSNIKTFKECKVPLFHKNEKIIYFSINVEKIMFVLLIGSIAFLNLFGYIGPQNKVIKMIFISILIIIEIIFIVSSEHYFKKHIINHIIKKHLINVFIWTLFSLIFINYLLQNFEIGNFMSSHIIFMIILASIIGIIPESGPHLIFVTMYAKGMIPFSVLLASSISQDGHGMLPLLSYSIRDSIEIKLINVLSGIIFGILFLMIGF